MAAKKLSTIKGWNDIQNKVNLKMKNLSFLSFLSLSTVFAAVRENYDAVTPQRIDAIERIFAFYQARQITATANNDTENELSGPCKPVTVIFARGTGESGNVGGRNSPGPALFSEMRMMMGSQNVAIQGVDYRADIFGYLKGGDPEGSKKYYNLTEQAASQCPDTKIVLTGYSQGAQLAHNAARWYSLNTTQRISAAVMFGDPYAEDTLGFLPSTKVLNVCHNQDVICDGVTGGAAQHLTYAKDASEAARFIMTRIMKG
ncbi:Cutinase [Erysiphe neolycopersici]|uniref:cutinase n=1 Tax=Erysiphe neolycopersici TaxID=212602 RepID=A0A420I3M3_9PEZI|nr:Cutinase [Erysiphe neolycopersici]